MFLLAWKKFHSFTILSYTFNTFLIVVLLQRIEEALKRRAKRYQKFQRSLTVRTRQYFDMMLEYRGCSGRIKIDHEEETLQTLVLFCLLQDSSSVTFSFLDCKL